MKEPVLRAAALARLFIDLATAGWALTVEDGQVFGLAPHVADLPATRDLATTVMGQHISLPVLISPTGVQAVHPDGEVAVARAAAARGTGPPSAAGGAARGAAAARAARVAACPPGVRLVRGALCAALCAR